jgi:hypothetical protein
MERTLAVLFLLTGLWLLASLVALYTWTRTFLRGRGWIETQKKRGENGVLRLIALQKYHLALAGVAIAALMLAVVATVLVPQPARMSLGRLALTIVAVLIAWMGWQFDRQSHRIMDKIRAEVIAKQAAEVDV